MSILSFDVGTVNLCYCLLSDDASIVDWQIVNLTSAVLHEEGSCTVCHKSVNRKVETKKPCASVGWVDGSTVFCSRHAPSHIRSINGKIKKADLVSFATTSNIDTSVHPLPKSTASTDKWMEYVRGIDPTLRILSPYVRPSGFKLDIIQIAENIRTSLTQLLTAHIDQITEVVIENQIGPLATRNLVVQGMLTQFLNGFLRPTTVIRFVSSSNKLKGKTKVDKTVDRKKQSIEEVRRILAPEWMSFFETNKKKDDLADSLLQGLFELERRSSS